MTVESIRTLFPHTERFNYVNHASTGPLSRRVVDALNRYIEERHLTKVENYFDFQPIIEETKTKIARLLHTFPERVEFMPNTSSALGVLASGIRWSPGDRIAIPACEFPANVYPFMNLRKQGVEVDFIRHRDGTYDLEDILRALTPRTRLLSLSWVQFLSGFKTDLTAVGSLCRDRGIIFCVDAIQGLGALEINVEASGVDFLASGGQKWLMATQGIGILYESEKLQEQIDPPAGWLHGPVDWDNFFEYELAFHPDARRFRVGTLNNLGITSLHAALGLYLEAGPGWCQEQILARSRELADGLEMLGLERYGTPDPEHASGIVTVRHEQAEGLFNFLKAKGIIACLRNRMLRFSPTYYNSSDEMAAIVDNIAEFEKRNG